MIQPAYDNKLLNSPLRERYVREPRPSGSGGEGSTFFRSATSVEPNNAWLRRVTKIIRHLRDDLARIHPNEPMPTTWMIKCLLASIPKPEFNNLDINQLSVSDDQWEKSLLDILNNLAERTSSPAHIRNSFFELDGKTPLFPNQELFGPHHANRFATLALDYLKTGIQD